MTLTILVVDDEKNIREGLIRALELDGYAVLGAQNGRQALEIVQKRAIDLVITDLRMPRVSGEDLLTYITAAMPNVPVIVLTGHGTVENAVSAMRHGAYDFLTKPVHLDRLSMLVKRALENRSLALEHHALKQEVEHLKKRERFSQLIGKSAAMQRVHDLIQQVASTKASILITGESGVGKELVAEAIHRLSDRRDGPFVKTHCAALNETLLESELFGHEKGAFSGAHGQKKGRFELAHQGTIFLDEIGELNLATQVKLLQMLQEKSFQRIGGENLFEIDVRLLSATNRDLKKEISLGHFREDLYYRLNIVTIPIPPLRDHREDIPLLTATFLSELAQDNQKNIEGIDSKARRALDQYSWPGNVRELRHCIESAVVLCKGHVITLDDLPPAILVAENEHFMKLNVGISLSEAEKEIISQTLRHYKGNKSHTAEVLGIGRKTLHRKLQDYQLDH